ncbi:DUF4133 domain-containing protein [Alistipes ihumii]|uniref:DUF4133 domain-containing protein n=1 Tax=Alistipes ihumii TaxID=1470347 RepID=UPI003AB37D17
MAWYSINKGIGKQVEFKGLRAQYLFIFAGGLLGVFILFVAMYLLGVPAAVCIAVGLVLGTALVAFTFYLNGRYGAHGLMKLSAVRRYPRRIIHRKRIARLMRTTNDKP